jgi:hypothetical protein
MKGGRSTATPRTGARCQSNSGTKTLGDWPEASLVLGTRLLVYVIVDGDPLRECEGVMEDSSQLYLL